MNISRFALACLLFLSPLGWCAGQDHVLYSNDFEKAEIGKVPDDMLVLDGGFTVKSEEGNKVLELPGAPLETYAVQFGPATNRDASVSAAIKSSSKGRRYPVFGVGLGGVAGYRLQVSPGKKALELYKDQELKSSAPFEWKSGSWCVCVLTLRAEDGGLKLTGKAWPRGAAEPAKPSISFETKEPPPSGRASLFASPFSGEPVLFDDLVVAEPK